jgi:hypothetical protein
MIQSTELEKTLNEAVSEAEITITVKKHGATASGKMKVSEYQFLKENHNVDPIEEFASQLVSELERGI